MKKTLLFIFSCMLGSASFAQLLYHQSDSAIATYRANGYLQTSSALNSQTVIFDDVHVPASVVAGYDSLRLTKLSFGILRYANAPATTMNVWITTVNPAATTYTTLINVPPTHVGSISLPAGGATNTSTLVSLGDSVSTLVRVKVDTGNYYQNYSSFYIGVSFTDTTGNGWILGNTTGNVIPNDNVFWRYIPSAVPPVSAFQFTGGYPRARFYMLVYGYASASLPVTLSNFKGQRNNKYNTLSWTTATESNNKGFELQRSADGRNFSAIAFIPSKATTGNSSSALDYSYNDEKPLFGNGYYRLKQIDKDDKSTFSNVVLIKASKVAGLAISAVYPNPAKTELNVSLNSATAEKASIAIINSEGKTVKLINTAIVSGDNIFTINVGELAAGTYFIKATSGTSVKTTQFVKQ